MIYKKRITTNNKAQMMVLESVVFAILVIISLIFLYQISPTSTESTVYTSDLKIKGDSALQNLYNEEVPILPANLSIGFPKNKLIYYLISDDYTGFISNLKGLLPSSTTYNIFVSNGTNKVLWFNSALTHTALVLTEPIAISHYFVAIHPQFFNGTEFGGIISELDDGCDMAKAFDAYVDPDGLDPTVDDYNIKEDYKISTYDVILEMSKI